jgi:hypothetical protein
MGTLSYMAPEQGMEGHSDVRSDIYSLGIILYEMLIQRPPFEADTPLAVLMKHVNDPLPLPRAIDPDLPEPFERLVLKALSKGPDDRYPSAEEMAQALRTAAEDAGVELPTRISLPLSFTTDEAPEESVAVFSGTARERIADVEFAADDTDASLGQRLGAQLKEGGQTLREAGRELLSVVGEAAHAAIGRANQELRGAVDSSKGARETGADERERSEEPLEAESVASGMALEDMPDAAGESAKERRAAKKAAREARRAETRPKRRRVELAVLGAVVLAVIGNLSMLTVEMPTGEWHIFERGWPIEIFLLGWGLCIIMYVAGSIWMLIPTGLALGTGALLAYTSLTGNWEAWNYLWIFEVWIAVISLVTPIFLARHRGLARVLSRILAILLSLVAIGGIVIVGVIVTSAVGLGDLLMGLRGLIVP